MGGSRAIMGAGLRPLAPAAAAAAWARFRMDDLIFGPRLCQLQPLCFQVAVEKKPEAGGTSIACRYVRYDDDAGSRVGNTGLVHPPR